MFLVLGLQIQQENKKEERDCTINFMFKLENSFILNSK